MHWNSIKKISENYWIQLLGVSVFFFLFGLYKFWDVLMVDGMSLTDKWDGLGGIAGGYTFLENIKLGNFSFFSTKGYSTEQTGLGLGFNSRLNFFQAINYLFINLFVSSPDNLYDGLHFFSYILNGIFIYLLLKDMNVSFFFTIVGGILINHLDIFYSRLDVHLFIGYAFMPVLVLLLAIRTAKTLSLINFLLFAFFTVINFTFFEYYGYFGIFFSSVLFISYFLFYHEFSLNILSKFILNTLIAGIFFIIVFATFYPTIVLPIVFNLFGIQNDSILNTNGYREWDDFKYYTAKNLPYLFSPDLRIIQSILPKSFFLNELWEFSYRIGLVIPATILFFLIYISIQLIVFSDSNKIQNTKTNSSLQTIFVTILLWLPACVLITLFTLPPDYSLSLVPFSYSIAPMFRVCVRAFLYVDITAVVLFCLIVDYIWKNISNKNLQQGESRISNNALRLSLYSLLILLSFLAFSDLSQYSLFSRMPAKKLPDTKIYEVLKTKKEGLLIELPFYSPQDIGEFTYLYLYNRVIHNKYIVNEVIHPTSQYAKHFYSFGEYVKELDERKLNTLCNAGLSYIAIHNTSKKDLLKIQRDISKEVESNKSRWNSISIEKDWLEILKTQKYTDSKFDYNYLRESSVLHLLADNGIQQVYEFKEPCGNGDYKKMFREWLLKEKF